LQKIQDEYKDKGAMVVMVNIDSERFKLGPFLKKNPPSATVILSDGRVEDSYGVQGIPLTLALDRKGMVRLRKMGFSAGSEHELRGALEALLKEQDNPPATTK
jgi:hypothetical protein